MKALTFLYKKIYLNKIKEWMIKNENTKSTNANNAIHLPAAVANGFLRTNMTESPRRNILEIKRSLLTGFTFFFPLPVRGSSVHISLTFSNTILQWRSKALTRPRSFLLFRQLISTWVLFLTDCVRTDKGPVLNSSSSWRASSSGVNSDFGLTKALLKLRLVYYKLYFTKNTYTYILN